MPATNPKIRILYPTRQTLKTRADTPFSDTDLTAAVVRGPHFVAVLDGEMDASFLQVDDEGTCERLFRALNAPLDMLNPTDLALLERVCHAVRVGHASHTSMSMGDAVEIDGRLWVCAAFGFRRLPEDTQPPA